MSKFAHPYRLVSLLQMLRFHPERFLQLIDRLEKLTRAIPDETRQLTYDERQSCFDTLNILENILFFNSVCEDAKLVLIKSQNQRIINLLGITPLPRCCDLRRSFIALHERIYDSLQEIVCFHIPSYKADYYNDTKLFGDDVATKFSSATIDIEEAGKCFAVGRYTATVFHLMRIIEIGVKAFANGLGVLQTVSSAQPSWGQVLSLTNQEIQRLNKSGDPTWTADKRSIFENIQADLAAVKNSWRNPTMHVENIYDEDRAEDIFNAVKGFMRHIAKHLDEAGSFTP